VPDDLTDEERELLAQHRASRRPARTVKIRGKLDSGAEYEFDADPDESERIIARSPELRAQDDDPEDEGKPKGKGKPEGGEVRKFGGRRLA
jgi:hypothetical protein